MPRIHTPIPAVRHVRTGTAFPPVAGPVPTMKQWAEQRANRKPWWKRLFTTDRRPPVTQREPELPLGGRK